MSYVLRIDENGSIDKVDDAQFPGSEKNMSLKQENLLVPEKPELHEDPVSLKMPTLNLMLKKPKESTETIEAKEKGGADPIAMPGNVNGTYGRTIKMPVLHMQLSAKPKEVNGVYGHMIKMPVLKMKHADSASAFPGVTRETTEGGKGSGRVPKPPATPKAPKAAKAPPAPKPHKAPKSPKSDTVPHAPKTLPGVKKMKQSAFESRLMTRFMESVSGAPSAEPSRYAVVLICEGLGNLGDGFYYTANALQAGAPKFEGQKCYANHPSSVEEEVLPERSVRDIIGHFENVQCVQNGDHAEIQGELVVMGGPDYEWVDSQLQHALQFSQKYTDKDFVGLSINAGGQATPMEVQQFLATYSIPASCRPKIEDAMAEGLTQVKVVDQITEAVSCDLVTQAGAGGRILKAL